MLFAHRVAPVGIASVGWSPVPSGRLAFGEAIHIVVSICALTAAMVGVPLDTPAVTIFLCAAILLFGLPHGTFDLALVRKAHADQRMLGVTALYLGCAAAMFAVWSVAPAVALVIFFGLSIVHFAEDWTNRLPSFLAHGTSTALLTAPALLHRDALEALFTLLAGDAASTLLAAVAVLVVPVSLAIASVAIIALWHDGHRRHAVATGSALTGTIFLPPVAGFALFFCLMHSPAQFAAARRALNWYRAWQWAPVAVPLTCAALGIAALIFATFASIEITGAMIITAFMTLSILTLPHMVVPMVVAQLSRYRLKSV